MRAAFHKSGLLHYAAAACVAMASAVRAQTPTPLPKPPAAPQTLTPAQPAPTQQENLAKSQATTHAQLASQAEAPLPPAPGTLVDQVIAVVNGDLVMESDVDEERRFDAFQPLTTSTGTSRQQIIDRLVDRALILQQSKLQPDDSVSMDEVKAQLVGIRKDIPACQQYHCETDAGWAKFVAAQGFTVPELEARWQQRMEILKFIEIRFRAGIRITPAEIKTFYDDTLLPQFRDRKATPPPLESVSDRIQEILLQRQVGNLLSDWLQSLKAQGSVRFMKPGEVAP